MTRRFSHRGATTQRLQTVFCAALHIVIAIPAAAQSAQHTREEGTTEVQKDEGRKWFVMEERPSIRFGDAVRVDFTGKLDLAVRTFGDSDTDTQMDQRRIGIDGRLFDVLGFQVERDLGDDKQPWRDVFVELRKWRAMRAKAGRFKVPFGQERLTSVSDLDFAGRSIASEALTSGRDTGLELSGRVFGRVLTYMAGVFQHDGDVSRGGTDAPGDRTVAARVVTTPLLWTSSRALRRLEVGLGMTAGDVPEGLNGLRARTSSGYVAVAPVYVAGRRLRFGVDASFVNGPVSIKGEVLEARDQRRRQGLRDEDLPEVVARGWYLSGTSFVVGRLKSSGAPRTPLGRHGIGALQLAARVESLAFGSDAAGEPPFRNPRAANVLSNDIRGATFGVNWFPVRFVKTQWNVIREHLQDPERRPDPARPWSTGTVFRVQFAM